MTKNTLHLALVVFCFGAIAGTLAAQEKPDSKPTTDKTKKSSDEELLKNLVPDIPLGEPGEDGSGAPGPDELDRTVKAMRTVGQRLDDGDTSDETRDIQAGILDDIDALIEKLKTQPPPQRKPNQKPPEDQSQDPDQGQSRSQSDPRTQTKPSAGQQQPSGQPTGGGAGQKQENKEAGESTEENLRKARARATALALRRALINEFWGHLPPSERERLLNIGSEKLLPHYAELIRRYYESLADTTEKPNR